MTAAVPIRTVKLATANANLLSWKENVPLLPWGLAALRIILVLLGTVLQISVSHFLLVLHAFLPLNAAVTRSAHLLIRLLSYNTKLLLTSVVTPAVWRQLELPVKMTIFNVNQLIVHTMVSHRTNTSVKVMREDPAVPKLPVARTTTVPTD